LKALVCGVLKRGTVKINLEIAKLRGYFDNKEDKYDVAVPGLPS